MGGDKVVSGTLIILFSLGSLALQPRPFLTTCYLIARRIAREGFPKTLFCIFVPFNLLCIIGLNVKIEVSAHYDFEVRVPLTYLLKMLH